jgi:uncharacterized protein with gpF-like domain
VASADDPYGLQRAAAAAAIAEAEASIFQAAWDMLKQWAVRIRDALFRTSRVPDVQAVFSTEPWFARQLDTAVLAPVRAVIEHTSHKVLADFDAEEPDIFVDQPDVIPGSQARTYAYIQRARNRLVGIPDSVFAQVNDMVMKGTHEGWGIDELALNIDQVLVDSDSTRWRNRAQTIARTEAVGAYNAGQFQGFVALSGQLGGDWEKGWLSTEDERTRPTHVHADLQRVPLLAPFTVGGFPGMFPGDPELPAQEVINCRCSMLLLRPGEQINYADRQSRG